MGCKNITEQTKHRLQAYNIDKINTTPILTDCETLPPQKKRVRYPFVGGKKTKNKPHPIGLVLGGGSPSITTQHKSKITRKGEVYNDNWCCQLKRQLKSIRGR
jgi:hypothetical protein